MRLGNLNIVKMESLMGVEIPKPLKDAMITTRQENVSIPIANGKWHCFHVPFSLIIGGGDKGDELLELVKKHLVPLSEDIQEILSINITKES